MDKREFLRRLNQASERARLFAERLGSGTLSKKLLFTISAHNSPEGRRAPAGQMKFLGGRFLLPEELRSLSAKRAADLLWVDGKVPAWVNLTVTAWDDTSTSIGVSFSRTLVKADESSLSRDINADSTDPIEPFRIRGPAGHMLPPEHDGQEQGPRK